MVLLKKRRLLSVFFIFALIISTFSINIINTKPVSAAAEGEQNNALLLIANKCQNVEDEDTEIGTDVDGGEKNGKESNCQGYNNILNDELGCSDNLQEEKFVSGGDPNDSSVGEQRWFLNQGNYKDCYNRALAQYNVLAGETCKSPKNDSSNWDKCTKIEDQLHYALGCSDSMYQKKDSTDHRPIKPTFLASCKAQIDRVGAVQLTVVGSDGIPKKSDKPISSGDIAGTGPNVDGTDDKGDEKPNCANTGSALGFVICPFIEGASKVADWIFTGFAEPILKNIPVGTNSQDGGYKAWNSFRLLANIILIGAMLVLVMAQVTDGWGFASVDAYTAKKMAPRILVGVIAINISLYLAIAAVDVTNVIGGGIGNLITRAFTDGGSFEFVVGSSKTLDQVAQALGVAVGGGVLFMVTKGLFSKTGANADGDSAGRSINSLRDGVSLQWVLLFIVIPIVLIALAILCTLVIRQALLVFLIIISPIAFACYILPGTEKYFKQWWSLFIKTLVVYPIISILFAMADVMGYLIFKSNTSIVGVITGTVVMFLPLVLIPFAFKMAGGAMGQVYGFASNAKDRINGTHNRPGLLSGAKSAHKERMSDAIQSMRASEGARRSALANAGRGGRRNRFIGGLMGGAHGHEAMQAELNKKEAERQATVTNYGNDDQVRALTVNLAHARAEMAAGRGRKDENGIGLWDYANGKDDKDGIVFSSGSGDNFIHESTVERAQARAGSSSSAFFAAAAYEGKKSIHENQRESLRERMEQGNRDGFGGRFTQTGFEEALLGASYMNKGTNLNAKHMATNAAGELELKDDSFVAEVSTLDIGSIARLSPNDQNALAKAHAKAANTRTQLLQTQQTRALTSDEQVTLKNATTQLQQHEAIADLMTSPQYGAMETGDGDEKQVIPQQQQAGASRQAGEKVQLYGASAMATDAAGRYAKQVRDTAREASDTPPGAPVTNTQRNPITPRDENPRSLQPDGSDDANRERFNG